MVLLWTVCPMWVEVVLRWNLPSPGNTPQGKSLMTQKVWRLLWKTFVSNLCKHELRNWPYWHKNSLRWTHIIQTYWLSDKYAHTHKRTQLHKLAVFLSDTHTHSCPLPQRHKLFILWRIWNLPCPSPWKMYEMLYLYHLLLPNFQYQHLLDTSCKAHC